MPGGPLDGVGGCHSTATEIIVLFRVPPEALDSEQAPRLSGRMVSAIRSKRLRITPYGPSRCADLLQRSLTSSNGRQSPRRDLTRMTKTLSGLLGISPAIVHNLDRLREIFPTPDQLNDIKRRSASK